MKKTSTTLEHRKALTKDINCKFSSTSQQIQYRNNAAKEERQKQLKLMLLGGFFLQIKSSSIFLIPNNRPLWLWNEGKVMTIPGHWRGWARV